MSFRDDFMEDLEETFFDLEEFASIHTIDGVEYSVVITDIETEQAEMAHGFSKKMINPKETAIGKTGYLLYVKASEFKRKITPNAIITLDGKKMFVQSVKKMEGVYKLTLGYHAV